MIRYCIYVIDDEAVIRESIVAYLEADYQVKTFSTAEEAFVDMASHPPDLILLDIGLPGMNGIAALKKIKADYPDTLVVMITAYEDTESVVSAMKLGAQDYIVKPLQMDSLEITIVNALETIRLRKEIQHLQEMFLKENMPCFVGESHAILDVIDFTKKVAGSPDTPILIVGETGTGKELIASAIHYRSPNFKGPFTTVNCAAVPKDLIESELFGYEKGAFSGASENGKKGLIEASEKGTLFLDEVGDLSSEAQAKLLRFLETGEFYRLGSTRKFQIRTRVVSATNKDLEKQIQQGDFRKDLYFRLGVIKLKVPSLIERREDILPLARYFLGEYGRKFDKPFKKISAEAENLLLTHRWAGNVRELKNAIERGVLIGKGPVLERKDLGIETVKADDTTGIKIATAAYPELTTEGINLDMLLRDTEKHYMDTALEICSGNESRAARLLNINHHTFRYRRKKLQQS